MKLRSIGVGISTVAVCAAGLWVGMATAGWGGGTQAVGLKAALGTAKEVPKPKGVSRNARGAFTAGLTRRGTGGTLSWRLTFRGLTGAATAAHIHVGKPGKAGPVAVALCGPCRTGARGTATLKAAAVKALLAGRTYVNVHTAKNPAGEIRGQVAQGGKPVPAPTGTTPTTTTPTEYDPPLYP